MIFEFWIKSPDLRGYLNDTATEMIVTEHVQLSIKVWEWRKMSHFLAPSARGKMFLIKTFKVFLIKSDEEGDLKVWLKWLI